jgi:hypothetical protein
MEPDACLTAIDWILIKHITSSSCDINRTPHDTQQGIDKSQPLQPMENETPSLTIREKTPHLIGGRR